MITLQNKTRIVATMGPATADREMLKKMILNGLNVCRINFSHGAYEQHEEVISLIRSIDAELGTHTAILADLQGPKIRIGEVAGGAIQLKDGQHIDFVTSEGKESNLEELSITYKDFAKDVQAGELVLLDDGKLYLKVIKTNGTDRVTTEVIHGGKLTSKKGVNLPNTKISLPCLTEKDKRDLDFALEHNISWIGLSFVRNPDDILELRSIIKSKGKSSQIIAKIEKPEAIENLDEIIKVSDGLMVARGDLGVEMPMQEVPLLQKEIVLKARNYNRPVIIATQMMESMIQNISPTRAEVNDVANAVLDGADAVMLSAETSVGAYPLEVIQAMHKIIMRIEKEDSLYYKPFDPVSREDRFVSDCICENAAEMCKKVSAKGIVTMTFSGYTALKVSAFRPNGFVYVFTSNKAILNMLSLVWGVRGFYYDSFASTDETIDDIKAILKKEGHTQPDDYIIHIASMPISNRGKSNMLRISHIK